MRFTFINPHYESVLSAISETSLPPLELVNCATILRKRGFDCEVLDANILRLSPSKVAERVAASDVVVVATSPLITWQCPPLVIDPYHELMAALKASAQQQFFITLGPSSLFTLDSLVDGSDLVLLGQPEPFFEQISTGMRPGDFFTLQGIGYKKKRRVVKSARTRRYDLTRMPQPDLRMLPFRRYKFALLPSPVMMVETSRGCPEGCPFCFQGMTNYTFSSKSVEQIVNELRYIRYELGIRSIFFNDLDISIARDRFKTWMGCVISEGIDLRWACQIRMSALEQDSLITLMAEAGCKVVCIGIESVNEKALVELRKLRTERFMRDRIRTLRNAGITVHGFFTFGLPYDRTEEDIERTLRFATASGVDFASFSITRPYPTTPFHDQVRGKLHPSSPEGVPWACQDHFTLEQLERMRRKALLRFYVRPHYLARHFGQLRYPQDYLRNLSLFFGILTKSG